MISFAQSSPSSSQSSSTLALARVCCGGGGGAGQPIESTRHPLATSSPARSRARLDCVGVRAVEATSRCLGFSHNWQQFPLTNKARARRRCLRAPAQEVGRASEMKSRAPHHEPAAPTPPARVRLAANRRACDLFGARRYPGAEQIATSGDGQNHFPPAGHEVGQLGPSWTASQLPRPA